MPWIESHSPSFSARHEESDADAAAIMLGRLEDFRDRLDDLFETTPGEIAVIVHPGSLALYLAHPWLPLARMAAAPAARRYMASWFSRREVHVLAPGALEERASAVPGSREALLLSPLHEYAHVVIGANNPALPPPFTVRAFRRYLRWAWLCEGAATHFAGQTEHLRPAITRRLREGGRPDFPPDGARRRAPQRHRLRDARGRGGSGGVRGARHHAAADGRPRHDRTGLRPARLGGRGGLAKKA